ncbi:MAG: hypothetical protein GWQ08_07820 [Verrucomicrobiaceae bacterium]|nr:hypothetical protein [Verrucomicrobiaceae bacterium]
METDSQRPNSLRGSPSLLEDGPHERRHFRRRRPRLRHRRRDLYHPPPHPIEIDLPAVSKVFERRWFAPVDGSNLQIGSDKSMPGGGVRRLGRPPHGNTKDWVILLKLP